MPSYVCMQNVETYTGHVNYLTKNTSKDVISWNAMVTRNGQNRFCNNAPKLFEK